MIYVRTCFLRSSIFLRTHVPSAYVFTGKTCVLGVDRKYGIYDRGGDKYFQEQVGGEIRYFGSYSPRREPTVHSCYIMGPRGEPR